MKDLLISVVLWAVVPGAMLSAPGYKPVEVSDSDITTVHARLGFLTVIEFPAGEEIEGAPIGDGAAVAHGQIPQAHPTWITWTLYNIVEIKPTKPCAETSMTVLSKSMNGDRHNATFDLVAGKIDADGKCQPRPADLKVSVRWKDEKPKTAEPDKALLDLKAKYDASVTEVERLNKVAGDLEAKQQANAGRVDPKQYAARFHADYSWSHRKAKAQPFALTDIYNDDGETFIRCASLEPPSFWEVKDGKPSLVQYSYHAGLYTIPKLVDAGELRIGKKHLKFKRGVNGDSKPAGTAGR